MFSPLDPDADLYHVRVKKPGQMRGFTLKTKITAVFYLCNLDNQSLLANKGKACV